MIKNLSKLTASALVLMMFSSCATIFTGSKAKITLDSNVERADIIVDGREYKDVTFPLPIRIPRGYEETIIKAEAKNQDPSIIYVDKVFNPVSIINLTNIFGWAIDAATGAITKPEFKFYEIKFEEKK